MDRRKPQIKHLEDAIRVAKENNTEVFYHIFQEYEVHLNRIPPHSVQEWHYHQRIEEVILVTKGEMVCRWEESYAEATDEKKSEKFCVLKEKDLVAVRQSIHTFANEGDEPTEFVVFRFVPDGTDKRELIKNDKTLVERTRRRSLRSAFHD